MLLDAAGTGPRRPARGPGRRCPARRAGLALSPCAASGCGDRLPPSPGLSYGCSIRPAASGTASAGIAAACHRRGHGHHRRCRPRRRRAPGSGRLAARGPADEHAAGPAQPGRPCPGGRGGPARRARRGTPRRGPDRRPRPRAARRRRRRPGRRRIPGREPVRRRRGASVLGRGRRSAGHARLQGDQHAGQHGGPPQRALPRFRLGQRPVRRSRQPRPGPPHRRRLVPCRRQPVALGHDHAARRAKAPLAQRRLARGRHGGRPAACGWPARASMPAAPSTMAGWATAVPR